MKKHILKIAAGLVAIMAAGEMIGCGSSTQNIAPLTSAYGCQFGCVTTTTGTPPTFSTGDTESWTPASMTALDTYEGYALNSPTNYIVNIALSPTGTNQYNGTLTIQFVDGANVHNGTFSNGNGSETYRGYNQSVNELVPGTNTYRMYFEDEIGAVILTMNQQTGSDTTTPTTGSLYFLNFAPTGASNPLYTGTTDPSSGIYFPPGIVFCWMIDYGPYACINNNLPPTTPAKVKEGDWTVPGYTLLGTIPTINLTNALGN